VATNPYFTQYHTQRFSFIGSPQQRDGTYAKDQRFLNMYPELIKSPISDGKKYYLKKRPGLNQFQTFPAGNANGLFLWATNNTYYTYIGTTLYAGTTAIITGLSGGTGGFVEFRDDSEDLLFFCDGIRAWTIDPNSYPTQVTDPNLPTPHLPYPIFMDGYIFLVATGTQTIHNSNLLDPTTWPVDGFIDAEMYPDNIVALAKQQNYVVAVGTQSIEFFYDNANATGSPLQRNAPAVSQFGSPAPYTVNQTETELILVGSTGNGGRTVWIVQGFQPTEIGNEPIREALDNEGSNLVNAWAFTIQISGHKFYVLSLVSAQRTFVYDFEEQMWHEWSSGNGTVPSVFAYRYAADSLAGTPVLLGVSTGIEATLDPMAYTDLGQPINCLVVTAKIDFDTIMRKRIYRLSLITDSPNGDNNTPMTVSWSDDDYNTFTSGVTLNINASYPTITQLGYTRRRAFQFVYQNPYPLRMEAFELDIIQEVRR
jgi:hypothetical protein